MKTAFKSFYSLPYSFVLLLLVILADIVLFVFCTLCDKIRIMLFDKINIKHKFEDLENKIMGLSTPPFPKKHTAEY